MIFTDQSILSDFRKHFSQVQVARIEKEEKRELKKYTKTGQYEAYLRKVKLEQVEEFNSRDLVYYFRDSSIEANKKYRVANFKKDMAIMKHLKDSYSNEEIILMIDFLFSEDNDYLDKPSINLMASNWINTIYIDSQDWADDKYVPHKQRGKKRISRVTQLESREYESDGKESSIEIGEW